MEEETEKNSHDSISILSHDIRTSLSATKWVLKMLLDEDLGPITEEQKLFIKKTYNNNEHILDSISQIIERTRISNDEIEYSFEDSDILDIVHDVVFAFNAQAIKRDIKLEFKQPAQEDIFVTIDKKRITSVIKELIHNAFKYTEKGSITVSLSDLDEAVEISIADTGMGIKPEDKTKVFEKYYRSEEAKDKSLSGSGLGLYAAKKVIENHKGTISFTTTPKQGTIFTINIPKKIK